MNSDEDNNPFADPSIRQATAKNLSVDYFLFNFIAKLIYSSSNQQTLNEYNPFTNKTVAAKVCLFEIFFSRNIIYVSLVNATDTRTCSCGSTATILRDGNSNIIWYSTNSREIW
jgi:hypothetical protein